MDLSTLTVIDFIENSLLAVLVIVTGFYTFLTHRIVKANDATVREIRSQNEALTRPYITISLVTSVGSSMFMLRVENTGRMPAKSLELSLDRAVYYAGSNERAIQDMEAFKRPIESFAPGQKLEFFLGVAHIVFANGTDRERHPLVFEVAAEYKSKGRIYKERTTIDFRPFLNAEVYNDPVAENIKHLTKEVAEIRSDFRTYISGQ